MAASDLSYSMMVIFQTYAAMQSYVEICSISTRFLLKEPDLCTLYQKPTVQLENLRVIVPTAIARTMKLCVATKLPQLDRRKATEPL